MKKTTRNTNKKRKKSKIKRYRERIDQTETASLFVICVRYLILSSKIFNNNYNSGTAAFAIIILSLLLSDEAIHI
jgi:uncharacterized membrane protein